MRKRNALCALAAALLTTMAAAQVNPPKSPRYDVKSEVTLRGKVTAVASLPDWMGGDGVNITLETPEALNVHVDACPAEFLKMLDFAVAGGDSIEVTGVWSEWDGNRVFIARTLTRQKVAISVRDPQGKPVW